MSRDIAEVLAGCALLRGVDDRARALLAGIAQRRRFVRQQVIVRQGEDPPGMFAVSQGRVRVYKVAPNGKEHVLHLASPGQTFLEVAVLGHFASPACCEAVEDSVCVLLPAGPLRALLRQDHELCLQLLTGLSVWVRQLVGLLEDVVLRDAVGRVARHLIDQSAPEHRRVEWPGLKKHLASHLNLTSETLSRTLRRLDEAGLIDSAGDATVTILDAQALRHAADGVFPMI